jgi:hypothetical protein
VTDTFQNADGDLVPWSMLDDVERSFYAEPRPYVVTEFGLHLSEYLAKRQWDEALAELYVESDSTTA